MKFVALRLVSLATMALFIGQPTLAQDMDSDDSSGSDDGGDDKTPETLLAFLGLTALDGNTTIGDGTGDIEGHMIATAMASKAADFIVKEATSELAGSTVILRSKSQTFDLTAYYAVKEFTSAISTKVEELESTASQLCSRPKTDKDASSGGGITGTSVGSDTTVAEADPYDFTASDLFGLARSDVALSNVKVTLGDQVLTNAFLSISNRPGEWVIPEEISRPTGGRNLQSALGLIEKRLTSLANAKFCDEGKVASDEKAKEKIAKVANSYKGQITAIRSPKDGVPSLLHRARLIATYADQSKTIKVLRYSVDKAGGTMVNTSNIFTKLGWPGVTIRGGLVVTYRLANPDTGVLEIGGSVICRLPKKLLQTITNQDIELKDISCSNY